MWPDAPWLDAGQRTSKRHARNIKQLGSVGGSFQEFAAEWRCSHGHLTAEPLACITPSKGSGCVGHQAQLQLGTGSTSFSVRLPPSLHVSATRHGKLDLQLQLLRITAEWPSPSGPKQHQVVPAANAALGFACRTGALLLVHLLFPDHTSSIVQALAVPVACWDTAAAVARASPAPVKRAAARAVGKLGAGYKNLGRRRGHGLSLLRGTSTAAYALTCAGMHTLQALSGPAAAVAFGSYVLSVLAPSSATLLQCGVALMAVSADYNRLGRDAAQGRLQPGKQLEGAWHACHKRAARRLAHFLGELPSSAPLGPALDAHGRLRIAAAVVCDGAPLGGVLSAGGAVWDASGVCGRAINPQAHLAVSASYDLRPKAVAHVDEHTSIDRSKLLQLFTGSAARTSQGSTAAAAASTSTHAPAAPLQAPAAALPLAAERPRGPPELPPCAPSTSYGTSAAPTQHRPLPARRAPASVCDSVSSSPRRSARLWSPFATAAAAAPGLPLAEAVLQAAPPPTGVQASVAMSIVQARSVEDPLAFLQQLQLYGRGDHGGSPLPMRAAERASLALRAAYLLLVFSPFLLLGIPLLLVAWLLLRRAAAAKAAGTAALARSAAQAGAVVTVDLAAADATAASVQPPREPAAAAALWLLGALAAAFEGCMALSHGCSRARGRAATEAAALRMRAAAWQLLLGSMSRGGAAFIKWGQWSATRRDLFPDDLCEVLSMLHDHAPVHSAHHSRRAIEAAFGAPPEVLFATFDEQPLASGSVAQVHRATLIVDDDGSGALPLPDSSSSSSSSRRGRANRHSSSGKGRTGSSSSIPGAGGRRLQVVVKVLHPRVAQCIAQDFRILAPIAEWAGRFRALKGLSLKESVSQFSATMTAQADLRVEAVHAQRFYDNFAGVQSCITVPMPVPGLVHSSVLVETFEEGQSVSAYMRKPGPLNAQIVALGVDAYLQMLLKDNFVHTDLHPGNIMVRALPMASANSSATRAVHSAAAATATVGTPRKSLDAWEQELRQQLGAHQQQRGRRSRRALRERQQQVPQDAPELLHDRAQLVLLDFGLAEELTPAVRHHFISFLNFIMAGDGLQAASQLLRWSRSQTCPNPSALAADMQELFRRRCDIQAPAGIDLDAVLKDVLRLARKHEVAIDSSYASLVIAVCVLVGFATSLDPAVNLADAAVPCLLAYSLTGRVMGRVY